MNHEHPATDLSPSQRATLEEIVVSERARTSTRIAALTHDLDVIVESSALAPPDDEHDPEGATIAFERAQIIALIEQARRYLDDLERAAARLSDDASYGRCEDCGQPIAVERLMARPAADRCVICAAAVGSRAGQGALGVGLPRHAADPPICTCGVTTLPGAAVGVAAAFVCDNVDCAAFRQPVR